MANYQIARVNRMLDEAGALLDFWSGAHLSRINGALHDAYSMGWLGIAEPSLSIIKGYRKIEDEKKNEDVLHRASYRALSSAHASKTGAVFFVMGTPDNVRILVSMGGGAEDVRNCLKDIPQLSVEGGLRRVQNPSYTRVFHGGVIAGFPAGTKLDMDCILDRMDGQSYRFAIVAMSASPVIIQTMNEWMREIQSEYESILPCNGRSGSIQNKMAQITTPEVDELIEVLKYRRERLGAATSKELFTTWIIYQAEDEDAAELLSYAIMGAQHCKTESSDNPLIFPINGMTGSNELFAIPDMLLWRPNYQNNNQAVGIPSVLADTDTVAGLFSFPRRSHQGFNVLETKIDSASPNMFNTYTESPTGDRIRLGEIDGSGVPFSIHVKQLSKHVLVAATTGGGKTNAAFLIIENVAKRGISVLMLVPSMRNYRELTPKLRDVRIYSRDSKEYPLRLNVMQPEPGILVADHIKELMICFKGAFGSEMEQAISVNLENLLVFTYEDFGIDINSPAELYKEWPTLSDVRRLLPEYRKIMLYGDETGSDVTGALDVRLANLTRGTAGMILDNAQNLCGADFCEGNVLIEEDELDIDTKPLVTGFILACRVNKYLRRQQLTRELKNFVVVEEAHQVFPRIPLGGKKDSPESVASKYFDEMLSQLGNYGTGILLVEQLPHRLGTAAIGNTNTKIIGKLDFPEDIESVAAALRLSPFQQEMLPFLKTGEMVVGMGCATEVCKVICDQVKE